MSDWRISGTPSDWPSTQYGPWFSIHAMYADIYPWWNPSRYKFSGRLPEYWYYWRCRLWTQWNVVRIPTLSPTWTEWDEKILHASMAIFVDYYESRGDAHAWSPDVLRREIFDPNADEAARRWAENYLPIAMEMESIYRWWTVGRFAERAEEDLALKVWHDAFTDAGGMTFVATSNPRMSEAVFARSDEAERLYEIHRNLAARNNEKEQAMLHRLIEIRQHLWT